MIRRWVSKILWLFIRILVGVGVGVGVEIEIESINDPFIYIVLFI